MSRFAASGRAWGTSPTSTRRTATASSAALRQHSEPHDVTPNAGGGAVGLGAVDHVSQAVSNLEKQIACTCASGGDVEAAWERNTRYYGAI